MKNATRLAAFITFIWFLFTSIIGTYYTWKWFGVATLSVFQIILLTLVSILIIYGLIRGRNFLGLGSKYFLPVVFSLFLLLKVAWIVCVPTIPQSDFANYQTAAVDIAAGRGLISGGGLNGWIWPLFLGLIYTIFGSSVTVGIVFSLILDLISLILLYLTARALVDDNLARWSVLLFSLWPTQIFFTSVLGTEHITLPLVLAGFFYSIRVFRGNGKLAVNASLAGIFFVLGFLSRPAAIAYFVSVLLIFLIGMKTDRRLRAAVLIFLGVFFAGYLSYSFGLRLINPGGLPDTMRSIGVNFLFGSNIKSQGMWNQEDEDLKLNVLNYPGAYKEMLKISLERYLSYSPRQLAVLLISKGWIFWDQPFDGYYWATYKVAPGGILAVFPEFLKNFLFASQFYFQAFLLLLASFGAYRVYYTRPIPLLGGMYWVILFATLIHIVLVTASRYHYIFEPLVMISGAFALAYPYRKPQKISSTATKSVSPGTSAESYHFARINHWDQIALGSPSGESWGQFYHQRLTEIYRFLVPANQRVLELGCGQGDLLASLKPSYGVGVDFSEKMIELARQKYPHLQFVISDVGSLNLDGTFDVVILSDLVNDLWDVQSCFEAVAPFCHAHTRLILNFYSRVWEPILTMSGGSGLSTPKLAQNWLTVDDVVNILHLANFDLLRSWQEVLCPLPFPLLARFMNRVLVRIWPFNLMAITNFIVAYPEPQPAREDPAPLVSVIVPARNEAGNIPDIFRRLPEMGRGTEIVFVEGHSRDQTVQAILEGIGDHPERQCRLLNQTGIGKGDAVRLGFQHAKGDMLMILDADLTVPPEELLRFYNALVVGKGEFINGVRLIYPMEKQAMQMFNFLGNKFFSLAFTWMLGQSVKDTLCGTKVMWKKHYDILAANRSYFGDFDPFGDFDLLFGVSRLNLKITDLPIRYRERKYGTTNIQRWKHGWLLFKMLIYAAFRLKFI